MTSRNRSRSGKNPRWLFALFGLGAVAVVLLLLAPMVVMSWVRSYLQQDAFRGKMEQFFGTQLHGSVNLAPLRWTGDEVTSQQVNIETSRGWHAHLTGLHLALDWNAFRQSKWRIINTGMDALEVKYSAPAVKNEPPPEQAADTGSKSSVPAWLRAYLPSKTEVDGVRVDAFDLHHGPWHITDSKLRLGAWQQGDSSVQAVVEGGIVETPVQLPTQLVPMRFNLTRATLRLGKEDLHLSEATMHWLGESEISVNGHLQPQQGTWKVNTHLAAIPLREILNDDWKLRLTGLIEGDLEISGSRTQVLTVEGDLKLKNAVLTALPLLNKLATYTGMERFKRLILDTASSHVRGSGEMREFSNLIIQSNGLMRVEGDLLIQSAQLKGSFMLGVTPEALKWIPGAQKHVFTSTNPKGPPGMLWTPLRISGSIDSPREDLTDRLIGGAGKALLNAPAEVVGKTSELLLEPVLGKDAAKKPGEVIKGATDAAGKAAEKGVDLLKGIGGGLFGK